MGATGKDQKLDEGNFTWDYDGGKVNYNLTTGRKLKAWDSCRRKAAKLTTSHTYDLWKVRNPISIVNKVFSTQAGHLEKRKKFLVENFRKFNANPPKLNKTMPMDTRHHSKKRRDISFDNSKITGLALRKKYQNFNYSLDEDFERKTGQQ
jgi:hypothetical protein